MAETLQAEKDPSGLEQIFDLMEKTKLSKSKLSPIESAASCAVKMAADVGAKAILVLSKARDTPETLPIGPRIHTFWLRTPLRKARHPCSLRHDTPPSPPPSPPSRRPVRRRASWPNTTRRRGSCAGLMPGTLRRAGTLRG